MNYPNNISAVYENGMFRPLDSPHLGFTEGAIVHLTVEPLKDDAAPAVIPEDILQKAAKVYEGLSDEEIAEIEAVAFRRTGFFSE